MFLLAESGSTKTDWVEFSEERIVAEFRTPGVNPDIQTSEYIEEIFRSELVPQVENQRPKYIFFYGAGLKSRSNKEIIQKILDGLFPNAVIEVKHDLLAAARAVCKDKPGIACILGTGSNSCLYDGDKIIRQEGGHGYLFGDEGSGADLGKRLIKKALHGDLPDSIRYELEEWVGLAMLDIRREVHHSSKPNVYLAHFSKFIGQNIEKEPIKAVVRESFTRFLETTWKKYPGKEEVPVCFVGSIAHTYADLLEETCAKFSFKPSIIIKNPITELVQYHMDQEKNKR